MFSDHQTVSSIGRSISCLLLTETQAYRQGEVGAFPVISDSSVPDSLQITLRN